MCIQEEKIEVSKCSNCGCNNVNVEFFYKVFYVVCKDCKNSTCDCKDEKSAIKEWNKN